MKFYECKKCGNIIIFLEDSGVTPVCCNDLMTEIVPSTTDGAMEKHVPVFDRKGNVVTVRVGQLSHPMLDDHYIKWIILQTDKGTYIHYLKPDQQPMSKFCLCEDEEVIKIYEYCNIHSLWSS